VAVPNIPWACTRGAVRWRAARATVAAPGGVARTTGGSGSAPRVAPRGAYHRTGSNYTVTRGEIQPLYSRAQRGFMPTLSGVSHDGRGFPPSCVGYPADELPRPAARRRQERHTTKSQRAQPALSEQREPKGSDTKQRRPRPALSEQRESKGWTRMDTDRSTEGTCPTTKTRRHKGH